MHYLCYRGHMNTYRPVRVESGHWAVEWRVDGVRQGLVWGWFATEGEAIFTAYDLALIEHQEADRSGRLDRRKRDRRTA
jgi:hypothetical protein